MLVTLSKRLFCAHRLLITVLRKIEWNITGPHWGEKLLFCICCQLSVNYLNVGWRLEVGQAGGRKGGGVSVLPGHMEGSWCLEWAVGAGRSQEGPDRLSWWGPGKLRAETSVPCKAQNPRERFCGWLHGAGDVWVKSGGGQGMMMLCVEGLAGRRPGTMRAPLPVWEVASDGDQLGLQGSRCGWWEWMVGMEKWTWSAWRRLVGGGDIR